MSKKWVRRVDQQIKRILALVPKDRLQCLNALKTSWRALDSSQKGWAQWMSDTSIIEEFTMEQLEDVLNGYRELVLAFLKFDRETTMMLINLREEASKKDKQESDKEKMIA